MLNGLNIKVNDAGNLEITATPDGIEYLIDSQENIQQLTDGDTVQIQWERSPAEMWVDLLESYSCNGSYQLLPPGLFALVSDDMPIITHYGDIEHYGPDNTTHNECTIKSVGGCYAFLDYAIRDEMEMLLNGETVIFTFIPDTADNAPEQQYMVTIVGQQTAKELAAALRLIANAIEKCKSEQDANEITGGEYQDCCTTLTITAVKP